MPRVVPAEVLGVELVAAVHRGRLVEVVLLHFSGARLRREVGKAVRGDRRRIKERDGSPVRLALVLRKLEEVERPLHVHLMRRHRGELAARGKESREVEDEVDLELGEDPLEDGPVEDRADELARDETALLGIERLEVDREDGPRAVGGEARDQAVADLSAGSRDEDDGLSHG
jgi:hypothetical protein